MNTSVEHLRILLHKTLCILCIPKQTPSWRNIVVQRRAGRGSRDRQRDTVGLNSIQVPRYTVEMNSIQYLDIYSRTVCSTQIYTVVQYAVPRYIQQDSIQYLDIYSRTKQYIQVPRQIKTVGIKVSSTQIYTVGLNSITVLKYIQQD